jgi:predicted amidohydrolase YtcJ
VTPVTLVFVNGRIHTGDVRRPVADAIAVAGRELALVGSSAEVRKLAGASARVVDLRGATVLAVPEESVLRRGGVASFVVLHPGNESAEALRVIDGVVIAVKPS